MEKKLIPQVPFLIACCVCTFMFGVLTTLGVQYWDEARRVPPTGMIEVEILEHCYSQKDGKWTLLEAADGQRCHIDAYRGNVGDKFFAWPDNLGGYRTPTQPLDMMIPPPQIDLADKDKAKNDET